MNYKYEYTKNIHAECDTINHLKQIQYETKKEENVLYQVIHINKSINKELIYKLSNSKPCVHCLHKIAIWQE